MTERRRTGWTSMVVERVALPPLLLLAAGLSASIQLLLTRRVAAGPMIASILGITGLLALLRIMDDLKDLDRDRVAHPDRPLARGALAPEQAARGVGVGVLLLVAGALALAGFGWVAAGSFLLLCALWAFLMYREFFAPHFLGERPLFYAVTHQVIVLPMYGFAASTVPAGAQSPELWWFAVTGLGASFSWEICRKLDPDADPVLATYLHRLGRVATVGAAGVALALVAAGAARLDLEWLLWPVAAIVLATLSLVFIRPRAYRWIAGAAALLAFVQPLAPALDHWLRGAP